jgi:hypothetical protein
MHVSLIVVSGVLANKPRNGGEAWVRLSYVLGLRRLGCDVRFVEQIDPEAATADGLAYFDAVAEAFDLASPSLLRADGRVLRGPAFDELVAAAAETDLLLNISGNLTSEPLFSRFRRKAYVDVDPGFTQFWFAQGRLDSLAGHDAYFTVGEGIGRPGCLIPTCGIEWRPLPPPVLLDEWPVVRSEPGRFTTIATWRSPYGPVEHRGHVYGLKVHEFRKLLHLPRRVRATFELALDIDPADARDVDALLANGWHLVDPRERVADPDAFRLYVQGSSAEFSAAQGIYVETRSGWLSDRTVRYLASGKPALVQDTGFGSAHEGLVSFRTLDEAVLGARRIDGAYEDHCEAARRLAEERFDSNKVLARLLEEARAA